MKEFIKSVCVLLALGGMVCSCSQETAIEENKVEFEKTEIEDLLTRREEGERSTRRNEHLPCTHFSSFTVRGGTIAPQIRSCRLMTSCERDHFNGSGAFLLI